MPGYEIKEWNEDNFDVNIIPYTSEAYKAGKYAFVSDYARFWILYNYGGVYFDTDVEVIKPMDDILAKGAYMGFERDPRKGVDGMVNPGLGFAVEKNNVVIKAVMEYYSTLHFKIDTKKIRETETIVQHTTKVLVSYGLKRIEGIQNVLNIKVYPSDFFAPIHFVTHRLHITNNTHTIHQYMASWMDRKETFYTKMRNIMPESLLILINKIKHPGLY